MGVICIFYGAGGFPFTPNDGPRRGLSLGVEGSPARPPWREGLALPAGLRPPKPPAAREPPKGADRGQRAGGAGVSAWRVAPGKGGGRTPVILYGGPPTDPAFTNGNYICKLTAKFTGCPGLQMATTEPPRGTLLDAQEGKHGTRPAPWRPRPPKPPAAKVYPPLGQRPPKPPAAREPPKGADRGLRAGGPEKGDMGRGGACLPGRPAPARLHAFKHRTIDAVRIAPLVYRFGNKRSRSTQRGSQYRAGRVVRLLV